MLEQWCIYCCSADWANDIESGEDTEKREQIVIKAAKTQREERANNHQSGEDTERRENSHRDGHARLDKLTWQDARSTALCIRTGPCVDRPTAVFLDVFSRVLVLGF